MNIYVSNLSFTIQDSDLKKLFTDHGNVSAAKVIKDKMTNQSRGFGFVEMANDEEGRNAIQQLNGKMIDGRSINVNEAKPKPDRDNRRFTSSL